ncbi:Kinesin light chain [Colletotrichum viniferum]|nr:Kinesin light chain [Colletotrichum viniferum]
MASPRPSRREDFRVALICALPIEFDAVALAFDETWPGNQFGKAPGDYNSYTLGRMGGQNAVLVLLHKMGKTSAASATTSLRHSFPSVNLAFLCGICGGVPNPSHDVEILLGDVIISENVVEYDYGRQYPSTFAHKNTVSDVLGMPVKEIRSFLTYLKTDFGRDQLRGQVPSMLEQIQRKTVENGHWSKYLHPGTETDVLFRADYLHRHQHNPDCSCSEDTVCDEAIKTSCADLQCAPEYNVLRRRLNGQNQRERGPETTSDVFKSPPQVFVGTMGSGDTVMKSGEHRDMMAQQHVCDYADSHKNKNWQGCAAVAAASATKAVLNMYSFATAPTASTATTYVSHTIEAPPPAFIVPYNENPDFVGRSEILERVKDLFGHSDTYRRPGSKPRSRVALHGLGGVGKTQIALAYCYWFKERYPDASVFWIHASNVERFQKAFSDIAREREIPGHKDKEVDIFSLVKEWLGNKRRGQWLLVIDNADDTEVFFPTNPKAEAGRQTTSLGHSIPECSHGSVLITTRNKQAGLKLTRGKPPIEIQRMTETETTQLLRTLLEDESVTPAEASLLSSRLEHLPLALAQAASFILENSTSIKDYVGLLDKSDSSMVDRLSEPFEAVGRDTETPHALTATWAISFKHIEQQKPMASNVLYLMSFFDRQAIPKQFVWDYCHETLWNAPSSDNGSGLTEDSENDFQVDTDLEVTQALGFLQAISFISKAGDDLFDMHRLVQLVTRKQLANRSEMSGFAAKALKMVYNAFPPGTFENRALCLQLLPHALAVLEHAEVTREKPLKEDAWLSSEVGIYFRRVQGQYQTSKSLQLRSLDLSKTIFGPEDKETTKAMCLLGHVHLSLGQSEEALEVALKALEVDQRVRPEDIEIILDDKGLVAHALNLVGRFEEAELLGLEVWTKRKEMLGEEHGGSLRAVDQVVDVYRHTGRLKEAEELCTRLVELTKRIRGKENPTTLNRMSKLADMYEEQGNYDKAEQLYLEILGADCRTLGETHRNTMISLENLSILYHDTGRFEEGRKMDLRLLEAQRTAASR